MLERFLCATHTGGQNERLGRVHGDCADVVWVGLERCDLLGGVVVVYAHLEVIRSCNQASSTVIWDRMLEAVAPATIQFFLAIKRPARTGTSVSSNVLTIDCVMYDQMWTCPAYISSRRRCPILAMHTAVQGREDPWLSWVEVLEAGQYRSRFVEAQFLPMPGSC